MDSLGAPLAISMTGACWPATVIAPHTPSVTTRPTRQIFINPPTLRSGKKQKPEHCYPAYRCRLVSVTISASQSRPADGNKTKQSFTYESNALMDFGEGAGNTFAPAVQDFCTRRGCICNLRVIAIAQVVCVVPGAALTGVHESEKDLGISSWWRRCRN
jgi:hypothetical protein